MSIKEDIKNLLELLHGYLLDEVIRGGEDAQDTEIFQGIKDCVAWLDSVQETASLDPYTCDLIIGDRVSIIGHPNPMILPKVIIEVDIERNLPYEVVTKYNTVTSKYYSREMIKLESRGGVKIGE